MRRLGELLSIKTTVTNHTIIRILTLTLAFGLGLGFIYVARSALVLILVAFFLALAISPVVNFLAKFMPNDSRGLGAGVAYIITLALLGTLLYFTVPPIVSQSRDLINNLPRYIEELETSDAPLARTVRRFNLVNEVKDSQEQLTTQLTRGGGPLINLLQRITSSVVTIVTVLILTFFMLVEGPAWLNKFWSFQPRGKENHRKELAHKMYHVVTRYVSAQLLIASFSAVIGYILLRVLAVDFALPLATLVGILGLIPLIGATLGAGLMIVAALFKSLGAALVILVVFAVYQQIENVLVQPLIQAKSVDMSPLLILISAIIGVTVAGILGGLVAIPIAACVRILVNDYVERHHLEHQEP